jgi:hypothetical protein
MFCTLERNISANQKSFTKCFVPIKTKKKKKQTNKQTKNKNKPKKKKFFEKSRKFHKMFCTVEKKIF